MEKAVIYLLILITLLFGVYFELIFMAMIVSTLLLLLIAIKPASKPVSKSDSKPQVRPIIVKRKYVGPESIYPSKMTIRMNPKNPPGDWSDKTESVGSFIGKGFHWLFKR